MKAIDIILVAILAIAPCTPALADQAAPAASLLYIDQQGWTQASSETKSALAADFMRVFCGSPTMSAVDLVNCLDRSETPVPSSRAPWLAPWPIRPIT